MLKRKLQKNTATENDIVKQLFVSADNSGETQFYSDKELWNAFKADSLTAYRLIYEKHVDALYNYGTKITVHCEIVEDCIQELFINLWIRKSKLGRVVDIRAYLFTSFRRRLLDLIKKRRKQTWISSTDNLEILFDKSSESDIVTDEMKNTIISALNTLSNQKKEAMFLRFYNNLSCSEISEIMGIRVQSVYNLIYSGLRVMKEIFKNTKDL